MKVAPRNQLYKPETFSRIKVTTDLYCNPIEPWMTPSLLLRQKSDFVLFVLPCASRLNLQLTEKLSWLVSNKIIRSRKIEKARHSNRIRNYEKDRSKQRGLLTFQSKPGRTER